MDDAEFEQLLGATDEELEQIAKDALEERDHTARALCSIARLFIAAIRAGALE